MKNLLAFGLLGIVALSVVPPSLSTAKTEILAQMQGSESGSIGPAVVGETTVAAWGDDEIVQLNNLRIQDISRDSDGGAVIHAAYDSSIVRCEKFPNLNSVKGSQYPCPMIPTVLYRVNVDRDTRLLLRTRQRASISDFAVGDRINVYGFTDKATQAIDAIIMRNLDKPIQKRFLQINNVEVLSVSPQMLVVGQREIYPCLEFNAGGSGISMPCPMGIEARDAQNSGAPTSMLYPMPRKYEVRINSDTKILDRNRRAMSFGEIAVGDRVNVYGYQTAAAGPIDALIVRDLSKPVKVGSATLRVVVEDESIYCIQTDRSAGSNNIQAPCGLIHTATVTLYHSSGKQIVKDTASGVAIFENVDAGTYTVVASASGYESEKQAASLYAGKTETLIFGLRPQEVSRSVTLFADQTSGKAPFTVNFKAQLKNMYCGVSWEFGDGASVSEACAAIYPPQLIPERTVSASHTYDKPGQYKAYVNVGGVTSNVIVIMVQ